MMLKAIHSILYHDELYYVMLCVAKCYVLLNHILLCMCGYTYYPEVFYNTTKAINTYTS